MCLLIETIRVLNGIPQHLIWHERRMARAGNEFWPGSETIIPGPLLNVPIEFSTGVVRCNIIFNRTTHDVTFRHYKKRLVTSLKLVHCNTVDYHVKYRDRTILEQLFKMRGDCDEILIVKEGIITDTSMSNIIFFDGRKWVTPAKPLLKGTCRERLLEEGWLHEQEIRVEDLPLFKGCKLINAMRLPEEEEMIAISRLFA